ncbi:hypothetical protein AV926_02115 [Myroides marinus]|uniref:HTH araC/xylS-type domain-containing protein n=2 Tax=Myroides TaxID=76831 RepID=A0A163V4T0_9FLAO|nr:helix-turn-helix domain-containing protein [Myroides marinus]KZE74336.1 hypothetical protein AV926_02115 [Myroides marinus]
MKKTLLSFSLNEQFLPSKTYAIKDQITLIDKPLIKSHVSESFKSDETIAIICLKGKIKGNINFKSYESQNSSMIIILSNQIVDVEYVSKDFKAIFIIMSNQFSQDLAIDERFRVFMSIQKNPCVTLNELERQSLIEYCEIVKKTILNHNNPYSLKSIKHITKAFFYGFGYHIHITGNLQHQKQQQEILVEKFLNLLQKYYCDQREIGFYSNKLNVTPKYLSKIVKECSGISAVRWVENHVVIEAKSLLKFTDLTIQQVSNKLNFPSQSFFGKYFKRLEGISPSNYRNSQ